MPVLSAMLESDQHTMAMEALLPNDGGSKAAIQQPVLHGSIHHRIMVHLEAKGMALYLSTSQPLLVSGKGNSLMSVGYKHTE